MKTSPFYHRLLSFASSLEKSLGVFWTMHSRPVYWAPVCLGLGIGVYFSLAQEPPLWASLGGSLFLAGGAFYCRRFFTLRLLFMGLFLISLGISAATVRTFLKQTPLLEAEIPPHWIEGTLSKIEELPRYQRLTLQNVSLKYPQRRRLPAVRVSLRGRLKVGPEFLPGDRLRLKAALLPPSGPVAPGTYDFRRRAFFEGLSGVGYGLTPARKVEDRSPPSLLLKTQQTLVRYRHRLTRTLRASLGHPSGEIAAALVTGDRSGLTEEIRQNFAHAGTAHLLAISGLHLSVIAGLFFLLIRTLLAFIPALSLRFSVKKWAAGASLVGTFGYLLVCGAPLPAQRAFYMSSLVLIAIMIDRTALTLRNVCLAAFGILLFLPESLILPSFQLSFSAVLALVAFYEALQQRRTLQEKGTGLLKKGGLYFLGVAGTSLIATLATTPFIVQTFHKLTLHAISANLAAVPWTSFVLIPLLLLYLALLPFDLAVLAEKPLQYAIEILLDISKIVASWPGSVIPIPPTSLFGLVCLTFGGLWLCLIKKRLRFLGLAPLSVALFLWYVREPIPDLFISGDLKVIALRSKNGAVYLPSRRGGRFARESFQSLSASHASITLPDKKKRIAPDLECLEKGVYRFKGLSVTATQETPFLLQTLSGEKLFDHLQAQEGKGTLIWIEGNTLRLKTLKQSQGRRPWTAP